MIAVAIVNHSTHADLTPALLARVTKALMRQCVEDVMPLCQVVTPALSFDPTGKTPAGASALVLFDNADQAGALGYHDETPQGMPYGRVFVHDILDNGGTIATGANSVPVTLSHELVEMIGNESVNRWADMGDGAEVAYELCDPVESDSYDIDGVPLSNFVLPAWFDSNAPSDALYDKLGRLTRPLTITSGGYLIKRLPGGKVENVFGALYPEWKKKLKQHPAARTMRVRCA